MVDRKAAREGFESDITGLGGSLLHMASISHHPRRARGMHDTGMERLLAGSALGLLRHPDSLRPSRPLRRGHLPARDRHL